MKPITTTRQALAHARKALGPTAWVRDRGEIYRSKTMTRPYPSTKAEHDEIRAELKDHRLAKPTKPDLDAWPGNDLVANYRVAVKKWIAENSAWHARTGDLEYLSLLGERYEVGTKGTVGLNVLGSGYSWDLAFAQATKGLGRRASGGRSRRSARRDRIRVRHARGDRMTKRQGSGFRDKLYWRRPKRVANVFHCFEKRGRDGYESLCGRHRISRSGGQAIRRPQVHDRCGRCDGLEMDLRGWVESGDPSP